MKSPLLVLVQISVVSLAAYLPHPASKRALCQVPLVIGAGQCSCEDQVLQCSSLTQPPVFNGIHYENVQITDSNLRSLGPDAFQRLNTTTLKLYNCQLNSIDDHAFANLGQDLENLDLSKNHLVVLPDALKDLSRLTSLDIHDNNIDDVHFTEDVLRTIGSTLKKLAFGSRPEIAVWPVNLKHLQSLQELNLTSADIQFLPEDAFHGFQGTLLKLSMQHTLLRSVPLAVARLRFLVEFDFDHNVYVGDYGVNVPIVPDLLPFLTNISLQDDTLTTFPDILKAFTKLQSVEMSLNDLKFVSDIAASNVKQIHYLSMRSSNITRVPAALGDITELIELDLSNNKIHSIDRKDIQILQKVKKLVFNNNPILYISDGAFDFNYQLETLELVNTNLTKVPCALESLLTNIAHNRRPFHFTLDISQNRIECTCELKWLDDLLTPYLTNGTISVFNILGKCETINSSIDGYIKSQDGVKSCPSIGKCASHT